jgi:hypothetical protein
MTITPEERAAKLVRYYGANSPLMVIYVKHTPYAFMLRSMKESDTSFAQGKG